MLRKPMSMGLLLALATLPACRDVDRTEVRAELMRADEEFAAASAREGREAWVRVLADDAVMVPAQGELACGLPAIRDRLAATGTPSPGLWWKPERAEVSSAGDFGYTVGVWEERAVGGEKGPVPHGRYVTVWRKQADGRWRAILDVGNVAPAAEQASEPPAGPQ